MTDRGEDLAAAGRLIGHFLSRLPSGWRFLLRANEDRRGAYMCNFMGPEVGVPVVSLRPGAPAHVEDYTSRFPAYGATAVDAVTASAQKIPEGVWIGERDGLG